jgi:hypothetical protein
MKSEAQIIKLPKPILEKLRARKHPGQSFAGVIEEMLNELDTLQKERGNSNGYAMRIHQANNGGRNHIPTIYVLSQIPRIR